MSDPRQKGGGPDPREKSCFGAPHTGKDGGSEVAGAPPRHGQFNPSAKYHRDLALVIYNVGVENSSPAVILENMSPATPEVITTERIKSHLQKYRLNRRRSEDEFLASYDAWMAKATTVAGLSGVTSLISPEMLTADKLSSGALAAHLGWATMREEESQFTSMGASGPNDDHMQSTTSSGSSHFDIVFPELTEQEKNSPLGMSMCYVMGLFIALKARITEVRQATNSNVGAPFAQGNQHEHDHPQAKMAETPSDEDSTSLSSLQLRDIHETEGLLAERLPSIVHEYYTDFLPPSESREEQRVLTRKRHRANSWDGEQNPPGEYI